MMNSSVQAVTGPWRLGAALAMSVVFVFGPVQAGPPDPADPAAVTPGLDVPPLLPEGAGGYVERLDEPRLPWGRLYEPDGRFVPESAFGAAGQAAPAPAPPGPVAPAAGAGGDARGVVRKVDTGQRKVTLKHGPIERLGMPGMTMVFRVRDPALLSNLEPGDEVAFDVEVDGGTFYVTGIRK